MTEVFCPRCHLASVFCLCAAADILDAAIDKVTSSPEYERKVISLWRERAKRHPERMFVEFTEDREA
jgi:hypothetical protein